MSRNPRRGLFGRRSVGDRASAEQLAALTAAFFGCESRMTEIGPAVTAAHAVGATPDPTPEWHRLREQYDSVLSVYLSVSVAGSEASTPQAVDGCLRSFQALTASIDQFAAGYARALAAGRHATAAAGRAEHDARVAATAASGALAAAPADVAGLRTVRTAADELSLRIGAFEDAAGLAARQTAGDAVVAAARELEARIAAAPTLSAEADRTIRSLTTRRQSLETRLAAVPDVMSSLLREFSAGCSADLADAPERARRAIDAGADLLTRAAQQQSTAPDDALDVAEQARDQFTEAGDLIDRVLDRQTLLREVRADPKLEEGRVRFRLRDAQRFALSHGLAGEWGSVLDAQSDRIERAVAALDHVHPDYWWYVTELHTVDARVTEIVDRMRAQIANPR